MSSIVSVPNQNKILYYNLYLQKSKTIYVAVKIGKNYKKTAIDGV